MIPLACDASAGPRPAPRPWGWHVAGAASSSRRLGDGRAAVLIETGTPPAVQSPYPLNQGPLADRPVAGHAVLRAGPGRRGLGRPDPSVGRLLPGGRAVSAVRGPGAARPRGRRAVRPV